MKCIKTAYISTRVIPKTAVRTKYLKFINLPISSGFSYMRKIGLIFYRQCVMSHNSSVWFAVISEKLKELFLKILLLQVIFILGKAKAFLVGTRMSNGQEKLVTSLQQSVYS